MANKNPHILLLQPQQEDSQEIFALVQNAVALEFPKATIETIENLQNIYKTSSKIIRTLILKADLIIGNMDGGNVSVTSNLEIALSEKKHILLILRAGRASSTPTILMDLQLINFALSKSDKFVDDLKKAVKEKLEPAAQERLRELRYLLEQKESEWLDFKREFHKNKAELIHDILCLSNSFFVGDRFLIFGIANNKTIHGTKDDPHRKTNADLHDFLRQSNFNKIPIVELSFQQFDNKEIGILRSCLKNHFGHNRRSIKRIIAI